jgi:hypothetical protein
MGFRGRGFESRRPDYLQDRGPLSGPFYCAFALMSRTLRALAHNGEECFVYRDTEWAGPIRTAETEIPAFLGEASMHAMLQAGNGQSQNHTATVALTPNLQIPVHTNCWPGELLILVWAA